MARLSDLALGDNHIGEIEGLDTLPEISRLRLDNNQIKQIKGLGNMEKLERIFLQGNPVFDWAVKEFGGVDEENKQNNYTPFNFLEPRRLVDYCKNQVKN